ncbi:MAG TPA: neprosin family prolyl endopeptidase [Polyangia bacterium]|nr:neprosin family prolyl endopeptidase [Polyangia bacterium]
MRNNMSIGIGGVCAMMLAAGACGGPPPEPEASATSVAAVTTAAAPGDVESARIKAFVDAHYGRQDVRHSFRTRFGEDIDCVDAYAQPALRNPALRGLRLPDSLPLTLKGAAVNPNIVPVADGLSDENGNARTCPAGTVPIVRLPAAHMRAMGFDRWLEHAGRKRSPSGNAAPPIVDGYSYVLGVDTSFSGDDSTGIGATLAIYNPVVQTDSDHSISQIWGLSQGTAQYPCSAPNCEQSLEVGWNVDMGLYGDGGDDDQGNTHLFIFSTRDGYSYTGCYNLITSCSSEGRSFSGSGFVMYPGAIYTPGQILSYAPFGATPGEVGVMWVAGNSLTGWQLFINGSLVGWYPWSQYANGQGGTRPLSSERITYFEAGGEVYDPTQYTAMGSGYAPTVGYKYAAYQRDLRYLSGDDETIVNAPLGFYASDPSYYTYSSTTAAGGTGWSPYFYFGGDGKF